MVGLFQAPAELAYSDFLDSDVITLSTKDSARSFKIHKALLESKCLGLFNRLSSLKEDTENTYRFHDTPEDILVRFIEWAYRGYYPETVRPIGSKSGVVIKSSSTEEGTTTDDGPLSCHTQMYIFAHVYGIWRLERQSFEHIKDSLKEIGKPKDEDVKLKVISAMERVFKEVHGSDMLLNWLGHYASFSLNELRETPAFKKLLEEAPPLSLAMLKYLIPASLAPWLEISPPTSSSDLAFQAKKPLFGHASSKSPSQSLFGHSTLGVTPSNLCC